MSGVRNIYVRRGDEGFWTWADEQAREAGVALSVWLTRLIRNRKYAEGTGEVDTEATPADIVRDIRSRADEALALLESDKEES